MACLETPLSTPTSRIASWHGRPFAPRLCYCTPIVWQDSFFGVHESTNLLLSVVRQTFANVHDDSMLRRLASCENEIPSRAQLLCDVRYVLQERQNTHSMSFESLVRQRPQRSGSCRRSRSSSLYVRSPPADCLHITLGLICFRPSPTRSPIRSRPSARSSKASGNFTVSDLTASAGLNPELMWRRPKMRRWISKNDAAIGRPLFEDPIKASKWDRQSAWVGIRKMSERNTTTEISKTTHRAGHADSFPGGAEERVCALRWVAQRL